ncbi:trehalose-6-phosphate synthase [Breoghania sp.]|uniref:alpha,alpha-trehalose-phosphate synthase (UDP-forming) n=1 Tax=Breoghania sp. TaxID=2065378 RepID=UPI002AA87970|nr:trehalose-6-phosphate synthase [Breoghania sp.]
MARLVVVSNRVGPLQDSRKAGGLAVGLVDALKKDGGLWFGWSGCVSEEGTFGAMQVESSGNVELATIDLNQEDYDGYYAGYANKSLWPVLHYRLDLAEFERHYEMVYRRVNDRFATRLKSLLRPDDIIWAHDYHFLPLGRALRNMEVENPIGFFLHIPFPSPDFLTALPNAHHLVRDMLAYDVVGFQTQRDVDNFRAFVEQELDGMAHADGRVTAFGRTILAKAYPIGIDTESFAEYGKSVEARRYYQKLLTSLGGRTQIIGVDRLDYSKGLPERLRAFEKLLEDYPEHRGKVSLMQVAPLSRSDLDAYDTIRRELESVSGNINARFADMGWTPIHCMFRSFTRRALAGIYRGSAIGLVTPLRDGMNLVAKEYVAAQNPENPGVLVLSRFAGAAAEMGEALIVNPYNREQVAEKIQTALRMSLEERKERWNALYAKLLANDSSHWAQSIVSDLKHVHSATLAA